MRTLSWKSASYFLVAKNSWRSLAAGPHLDLELRVRFLRLQALFHCFMEINIIVLETCMATACKQLRYLTGTSYEVNLTKP